MNRYATGIAAALACLGLGGMLSGFAPDPSAPSAVWRGDILSTAYSMVPLSRSEEDLARQTLADAPRRLVTQAGLQSVDAPGEPHAPGTSGEEPAPAYGNDAPALFAFDQEIVSILTSMGPRLMDSAQDSLETYGPNSASQEFMNPSETFARPLDVAGTFGPGRLSSQLLLRADLSDFMDKGPLCLVSPSPVMRLAEARQPLVLRVTRYQAMVERYAATYGLDVPLVLAIIQTESGFNPGLVSSRDAHGLMQVVPASAGGEVHRWLGRSGLPSRADLLNPETNIRYGMVYMHLLRSKHFEGVTNPQSLEYCVIAAYNGGSGAVLRSFAADKEEAVRVINAMPPQEVLTHLTERFPFRETRHFVRKVLDFRRQYVILAAGSDTGGESESAASM